MFTSSSCKCSNFVPPQQEGEIANMENRNYYSLHCLQMETQLIHAHLDIFHEFVACMANVESKTAADVSHSFPGLRLTLLMSKI